jgi:hypothetical protein
MPRLLAPDRAWRRLRDMQSVVEHQPAIAYAVQCLTLRDQLELTLELLKQNDWAEFQTPEPPGQLPPNVIRFRPRASKPAGPRS